MAGRSGAAHCASLSSIALRLLTTRHERPGTFVRRAPASRPFKRRRVCSSAPTNRTTYTLISWALPVTKLALARCSADNRDPRARLSHILDLLAEDDRLNVYAGELEMRP